MKRCWPSSAGSAAEDDLVEENLRLGIGLGFFLYDKKQSRAVPLLCGVALMIYPYFMPNVYALLAVGAALLAIAYFVRD